MSLSETQEKRKIQGVGVTGNWRENMNKKPCTYYENGKRFPFSSSFSSHHHSQSIYIKYNLKTGRPHNRPAVRTAVVDSDGNLLKFCPGNNCQVLLPLHQFANNCNMQDGLDTYCIECNKRKRKERDEKRTMFKNGSFPIDKYEQFKYNNQMMTNVQFERKRIRKEEKDAVLVVIDRAIDKAKKEYKRSFPVTSSTIYDKLFAGRRLRCDITNEVMTPTCFLEHHDVRLVINDGRLDVKCNRCSVP